MNACKKIQLHYIDLLATLFKNKKINCYDFLME